MHQVLRSGKFTVTRNKAFAEVIKACATSPRKDQPGTWITAEMQKAYITLHRLGLAHSVEVWEGESLAGGLYGVETGSVFCGESMFSKVTNASKIALIWLAQTLKYELIDCQLESEHLSRLGAETISRGEYLKYLE